MKSSRDRMSSSPRMMRFMRVLMPWVCKKTFLGVCMLMGLDVIQQAESGTGKTATFCSGVLQQIDFTLVQCQALVMAPTRELTQKFEKVMHAPWRLHWRQGACVGGTSVREVQRILQAGVHVVVGTSGRVFDMLRRQSLRSDCIKTFVLDEL